MAYTTPLIIALLALNSFLLVKLNSGKASNEKTKLEEPAVMNLYPVDLPGMVISEGDKNAIPLELISALQALSSNVNEIRLAQKKIQKDLARLDAGAAMAVSGSGNAEQQDKAVVENSAENQAAFGMANQAVDALVGASNINAEVLSNWTAAMPNLNDRQRAAIRNRISAGVENGEIDPSVVGMLSM